MAIAIDSRNVGTKSAAAASLSWTHTVGAALTNGFLIVGCYGANSPRPTVSGVLWDSGVTNVAMSNTVNAVAAVKADASFANVYLWYLAAPAAGAKTVKVTYSATCECSAGSESLSGVDGSSTFNASSPQSNARSTNVNPTTAVTSAAGEWVVDAVSCIVNGAGAVTPVVGASQTQMFSQSNGAGVSLGCGSDEAAAGASTTMDWTGFTTNNDGTAQVAFSLKAAAASLTAAQMIGIVDQQLSGAMVGLQYK